MEKRKGGIGTKLTNLTNAMLNKTQVEAPASIADKLKVNWIARWFVLKDGILFKYKAQNDTKPSSKLALYGCTFSEYEDPASEPSAEQKQFQITTTTKKTIILRATSETEMHEWLNAMLKQKLMIESIIDAIEAGTNSSIIP